MSMVQVKLLDPKERITAFVSQDPELFAQVRKQRNAYTILPLMSFEHIALAGEDMADCMFDMTNNPLREEERLQLYGNSRSISVGDIVSVDGVDFLCLSFGWKQLPKDSD